MMKEDRNKQNRPESYPKPTETDKMLKDQPEFIDQEPNSYTKEISDVSRQEENDEPDTTRATDGNPS